MVPIFVRNGMILADEDIALRIDEGVITQKSKNVLQFKKRQWRSKRTFYELYQEDNKMRPILAKKIMQARHQNTNDERKS